MATILPEVRLNQQGVNLELPPSRRETWYGWEYPLPGYYLWSRDDYDPRLGRPTIQCDVVIPEILIGDPKDIHRDISESLGLHAQAHLRAPSVI